MNEIRGTIERIHNPAIRGFSALWRPLFPLESMVGKGAAQPTEDHIFCGTVDLSHQVDRATFDTYAVRPSRIFFQ